MTRYPDWLERLHTFVADTKDEPFSWGRNDCALFVSDCIFQMTGRDPAEPFRGKYRTEGGAYRSLRKIGGVSSLEELATKYLGAPIPVFYAGRGDVVSMKTPTGKALGIVLGDRAAFRTPEGLCYFPREVWEKAWRVI